MKWYWKLLISFVSLCIQWSIIIIMFLTVMRNVQSLRTKVDLQREYILYPPSDGGLDNLYRFSGMKYYTQKTGITYYAPVYIRMNDLRDNYLTRAIEYGEQILNGASYTSEAEK